MRAILVLYFAVGSISAIAQEAGSKSTAKTDYRFEQEGHEISHQFGAELKQALMSAIQEDGLTNAISVCKTQAPRIAKELSEKVGAKVKRVTLKPRNPDNLAQGWNAQVLKMFENGLLDSNTFYDSSSSDTVRFMKAVKTDAICLACHGMELDQSVAAKLDEFYPDDMAREYSLGQIRGAFSIEWQKQEANKGSIKNYKKISEKLYVAGQPRPEQFALLKQAGISTVINIRDHSELDFDEQSIVEENGLEYVNFSVASAEDVNFSNSAKLSELIDNSQGKVLLHCGSTNRVGALLALDELKNGMDEDVAFKYGELVGMTSLGEHVKAQIEADKSQKGSDPIAVSLCETLQASERVSAVSSVLRIDNDHNSIGWLDMPMDA